MRTLLVRDSLTERGTDRKRIDSRVKVDPEAGPDLGLQALSQL